MPNLTGPNPVLFPSFKNLSNLNEPWQYLKPTIEKLPPMLILSCLEDENSVILQKLRTYSNKLMFPIVGI